MRAFIALNATIDENIEKRGIPRVFYHGKILERHHAIVMTLFEETLYDRFKLQNKKISELSTLLIFKRAVSMICLVQSLNNISIFIFFDLTFDFYRNQDRNIGVSLCAQDYA